MQTFGILLDLDHTLLHTCTEGNGGDEEATVRNAQQIANRALTSLLKSIPHHQTNKCVGGGLDIVLHPSHPRLRTFNPGAPTTTATTGLAYVVLRPCLFQFLCYLITAPNIAEIAVWSAGGCEYVMSLVEKILLPLMSHAFQAMYPSNAPLDETPTHHRAPCTGDGPHRYTIRGGAGHRKGSIVVYTGGNCEANKLKHKPPKHLKMVSHRPGLRWILLDDIPENVGLAMCDDAMSIPIGVRPVTNGGFVWIPPFDGSQPGWHRDRYLLSAINALSVIKNPPKGVTDKKKRDGGIGITPATRKACRTSK